MHTLASGSCEPAGDFQEIRELSKQLLTNSSVVAMGKAPLSGHDH